MIKSHSQIPKLQKRQLKLLKLINIYEKKLQYHQHVRLGTGLVFFVSLIPLATKSSAQWEYLFPLAAFCVFVFLVYRTRSLSEHLRRLRAWHDFTLRQERRGLGLASGRDWKNINEIQHDYPLIKDIGLTGSHSLWTLLDETLTEAGQRKLLAWMSTAPLNTDFLRHRQERLQSLKKHTWFYCRLILQTPTTETNVATTRVKEFIKDPFVGVHFYKILFANLVLFLLIGGLYLCKTWGLLDVPSLLIMSFPLVSWLSLSSTAQAFSQGVGLSHHLQVLGPLFEKIEKRADKDASMKDICTEIQRLSPSYTIKKLDFILSFVGTQTNPLLHFLLNAFLPWSLLSVYFLEKQRQKIFLGFTKCLEELAEIEVLGSLLIFSKYQTDTYPSFSDESTLQFKNMFHPLLERSKAVPNSFALASFQNLGLLTGSNMSGKSTFLRTLGINQVLANMGAPVFADEMITQPVKIETCIEVSDSLRDGYSYFYAEVRRLRDILKSSANSMPILFLIDEIFRGTNNKERHLGSKAVIKSLAEQKNALGFISTHDLELTHLEKNHPSLVNLHFREDINSQGEMVFSYQLKSGACPTTNALRIMKSEGIQIEDY